MTKTQEVINYLQPNNFFHVPISFVQHEFQSLSSWQQHTHLFAPTILSLIVVSVISIIVRKCLIIRNNLKQHTVLLEITPPAFTQKSAYTTEQLFSVIHNSRSGNRLINWALGKKTVFSFEIASTRKSGIKYFVRTEPSQKENMKRKIMSYLPNTKVQEGNDYLPSNTNTEKKVFSKVIEFILARRFAYPLEKQHMLNQHDPVAYITGMMTQLQPGELVSMQIVLAPTHVPEARKIANMILRNEDVLAYLDTYQPSGVMKILLFSLKAFGFLLNKVGQELQWAVSELFHGSSTSTAMNNYNFAMQQQYQQQLKMSRIKPVRQLSSFEEEVIKSVQAKVDQPLFEATIRVFVAVSSKEELQIRLDGLRSAFEPFAVPQYQSLQLKLNFPPLLMQKIRTFVFEKRILSLVHNKSTSILSASEVADLYHFPFSSVTQTENIVKVHSREFPASLSLKQQKPFDVVFGKNTYGGVATLIGLTKEQRAKHVLLLGQTGGGKSTIVFTMARGDIVKGRGLAVIDPHGDLAEELLYVIPLKRKDELIYFDPFDLENTVAINLLELTEGLTGIQLALEKELVCESIISIFRRVFSNDEKTNAHRIEYILRNTIYTAFTIPDSNIFTIYDILNNPDFRKKAIVNLEDQRLKDFWNNEFGQAGSYQVIKMVSGVTAKVGRFLFSPIAKSILDHAKSTINFDKIVNEEKIFICNFSEGNLGEDTSNLLGTTIVTKLYQAGLKRGRMSAEKRTPFYIFVDEFQNFATTSFSKMLSGGRKFGLRITIAEQSTAQQDDRNMVNVILANTATVICFRTASPIDKKLMQEQFAPYIEETDIQNLPEYHFYIKIAATKPEEPFSGETIKIPIKKNMKKIAALLEASRKNYTTVYVPQKITIPKSTKSKSPKETNDEESKEEETYVKSGLPEQWKKSK